jgi:mevalonate kinase
MSEQYFYGHGKLLLSGEYFVLDGAKSIALPTKLGQKMHVKYRPSHNPKLYWKSYDVDNQCWLETSFELWRFGCLGKNKDAVEILKLQEILVQARKQNIHFLRDDNDIYVETVLEFPITWGLGSSSTLVYNVAQWAYVSPFELQAKTFKGSGYDIACAQSMGPISYQVQSRGPHWETLNFAPPFKDKIYFVYLNEKQDTRAGIKKYNETEGLNKDKIIKDLNSITEKMLDAVDLKDFENQIFAHENIISKALNLKRVFDTHFSDYWGAVKSLGAWGGDFVLVTSDKTEEETFDYFKKRGHETIFTFDDLILQSFQKYGDSVQEIENVTAPN